MKPLYTCRLFKWVMRHEIEPAQLILMKNLTHLTARRLIIHITDQKLPEFRASTAITDLTDEVREYIELHLSNALKASATHAACFQNLDADAPAQVCRDIATGKKDLIVGSEQLAKRLLHFTKPHYTRGNLAVVLFDAQEDLGELGSRTHDFLALMKLDLGSAFLSEFDEATGATMLRKREGAVPTNKEGLQKCAFISCERWGGEEGYDMMLLDRQSSRGGDSVADFWKKSFLDAVSFQDDTQRWHDFKRVAAEAVAHVTSRYGLTEPENRMLKAQIHEPLNHSHFDAIQWARDLAIKEDAKDELESILTRKLTSPEFDPPIELREKEILEFRGDGNLTIKIPFDLRHKMRVDESQRDQAGNKIYKVTIETTKWIPK